MKLPLVSAFVLVLGLYGPLSARPMTAPERARAARVRLAPGLTGADLERIHVGNQAGILRVVGADHHTVRFLKGTAESDVTGIDGVKWAPLTPADRSGILAALDLPSDRADATARLLTQKYALLPRLETVALLGVLAGVPSVGEKEAIVHFLIARVLSTDAAMVRRQAVLSLALIPGCGREAFPVILKFLQRDHNVWNTFTTVQFFEYHMAELRGMTNLEQIKKAVTNSGNPHAEEILQRFEAEPTPTPTP